MATDFDSTVGYLKRGVIKMLDEQAALEATQESARPSHVWQFSRFFRYLLDLSPENLRSIRFHSSPVLPVQRSGYLADLGEEEYSEREARRDGYVEAIEGVPEEFWIGEPDAARFNGPLGKRYRGRVVNRGTFH